MALEITTRVCVQEQSGVRSEVGGGCSQDHYWCRCAVSRSSAVVGVTTGACEVRGATWCSGFGQVKDRLGALVKAPRGSSIEGDSRWYVVRSLKLGGLGGWPWVPAVGVESWLCLWCMSGAESSLQGLAVTVAGRPREEGGWNRQLLHLWVAAAGCMGLLGVPVVSRQRLLSGWVLLLCLMFATLGLDMWTGFWRYDCAEKVRLRDMKFCETHMTTFLEKRKTDKYRYGQLVEVARAAEGQPMCPVEVSQRWVDTQIAWGVQPDEPLFQQIDGRRFRRDPTADCQRGSRLIRM
ncbi:hypothetical protein CYMTET_15810 [Cymbomonas tetramitiformis]|uniref:Uncharacterized protein n=1 Tax=Cymbomonas tetramitiformis TaxID=36881 RepID=A0AAE0GD94_9CHLO|nr:hypothetical protein CYMTET_15810 [Cymbomonas tetramitiformis]